MSKLQEIQRDLWNMANDLRGTMDASEYKNYILPFMFYRYLSERQDKFLEENSLEEFYEVTDEEEKEDYLQEISSSLGYAIEKEYTWTTLMDKINNHSINAGYFQLMLEEFNKNARRQGDEEQEFADVFSDVNLGDNRLGNDTNERANALIKIVNMINEFEFKDETGHDVLGDVYEYLIGQFAANAGKKGGEFYTPHEVSQILSKIVTLDVKQNDEQFRVYDPTMGSGSLLLTVQHELNWNNKENAVDFFGQELNKTTYNLARMNLMMHDVNYQNMTLRCADTLNADWPFIEKNGVQSPVKFDAVVANPPYSQKWDIKDIDRSKDVRFKGYGIAPASKADYAFVLHGLYHLESTGTMAIVLPHGVLFRGASEGKIRTALVDNNLLDAVIGLPQNLFYGTSIPTCILVFKGAQARKNKDILFIDASNEFEKNKNKNKLLPEHIDKIIETYRNRETIEKYSYVASLDEIKENDYNLNIPRYVDTFEEEEVVPLADIAKDLANIDKEIEQTKSELFEMFGQLVGTTEEANKDLMEMLEILK